MRPFSNYLLHCGCIALRPTITKNYSTHDRYKRFMAMANSSNTGTGTLDFNAGPLVWIDCEMTGLNPKRDTILEIAVIITNGDLQPVDEGIEYIIHTEKEILDEMDEWCTNQHGSTGLTKACIESPYTQEFVASKVLEYVKKWIPQQRIGVLAGNSVHADRSFLVEEMPKVVDWLHYRIVDVSSIKELARRWYPNLQFSQPTESNHRALSDIKGSIKELRFYRDNIFVSSSTKPFRAPRFDKPLPDSQ